MDDVAIIDTLRDAAEALSLAAIQARSDLATRQLSDLARDCLDAARALAVRHLVATGGGETDG